MKDRNRMMRWLWRSLVGFIGMYFSNCHLRTARTHALGHGVAAVRQSENADAIGHHARLGNSRDDGPEERVTSPVADRWAPAWRHALAGMRRAPQCPIRQEHRSRPPSTGEGSRSLAPPRGERVLDNDDPIRRMLRVNPLNGLFIALAGRDHGTIRIELVES